MNAGQASCQQENGKKVPQTFGDNLRECAGLASRNGDECCNRVVKKLQHTDIILKNHEGENRQGSSEKAAMRTQKNNCHVPMEDTTNKTTNKNGGYGGKRKKRRMSENRHKNRKAELAKRTRQELSSESEEDVLATMGRESEETSGSESEAEGVDTRGKSDVERKEEKEVYWRKKLNGGNHNLRVGWNATRHLLREYVKTEVFKQHKFVDRKQKNSNAENLVKRGLEQKNLQPLDGVEHDVFVKECSKMMVQITNERRQNVQQKMQKQYMSE